MPSPKNLFRIATAVGLAILLSGCVIEPGHWDHWHHWH
jgi:hypothetical protein